MVPQKRMRDYGLHIGKLPTGAWNSITDVPGVNVGHVTLNTDSGYGQDVCTGVTAILPHAGDWFRNKVTAAAHVINGFGKTVGLVQVDELGVIESPILLTNTFSVPAVTEGVLQYMLGQNDEIGDTGSSLNIVVGECNDSYLNDMRGLHVRPQHAIEAIRAATTGPVDEGAVGAGAGMRCFGWKGGIGTASRQVQWRGVVYHIGSLVLSNFGVPEDLTIAGYPVGQWITPDAMNSPDSLHLSDGSIMMLVATDLPVDAATLKSFCKRAGFGLARTGSIAHHGSGDIVIAFSNATSEYGAIRRGIEDGTFLSECFRAVAECTEESILNSLFVSKTTRGRHGRVVYGLPAESILNLMKEKMR